MHPTFLFESIVMIFDLIERHLLLFGDLMN